MVQALPPTRGVCRICVKPLGIEPHFIRALPNGEHVRCMAAAGRPWPYQPKLEAMRRAYRRLRRERASAGELATVEAAGRALRRLQAAWPAEWTAELDAEVQERIGEAEGLLLAHKRERQQRSIPAGWRR